VKIKSSWTEERINPLLIDFYFFAEYLFSSSCCLPSSGCLVTGLSWCSSYERATVVERRTAWLSRPLQDHFVSARFCPLDRMLNYLLRVTYTDVFINIYSWYFIPASLFLWRRLFHFFPFCQQHDFEKNSINDVYLNNIFRYAFDDYLSNNDICISKMF